MKEINRYCAFLQQPVLKVSDHSREMSPILTALSTSCLQCSSTVYTINISKVEG